MKYPLISVVIPARNEEKTLPVLLESIKRQTYPNYEIVVVDNASVDRTSSVAKGFTNKVILEKEVGILHARDTGFSAAIGDIVARIDADSIPPKNWLMDIYNLFNKHSDAVAVTGGYQFNDVGYVTKLASKIFVILWMYLGRIFMGHYQLVGANMAIKKNVLNKVQPHKNDAEIHEDMDLGCHVSEYGEIVFSPSLEVETSGRKVRSGLSFVPNYIGKAIRTYFLHHPNHKARGVR